MRKKIIYVDFTKKRRINLFHFTFNKVINFITRRINVGGNEVHSINKKNKHLANKIYYL